ncbi:MAG: single-stranded DNA-binding protein [Kaiparowitsia implicata GSE-PSE-MK54-09C]|jgi:single-stranded DNA-binding protein|nr:single-stranded DNA-binding protein [Kaiparowitsia implicata GSE-PSE-MK54-09C]
MSSAGLNKWIVSGNLAADAQVKTIELRNGSTAKVASATLYVRKPRNRDESFTVSLSIWESSAAWRKLQYLKKGSLIICTGSVDANPYIASNGNQPRAGLEMSVLDIDLDVVKGLDEADEPAPTQVTEPAASGTPNGKQAQPQPV